MITGDMPGEYPEEQRPWHVFIPREDPGQRENILTKAGENVLVIAVKELMSVGTGGRC